MYTLREWQQTTKNINGLIVQGSVTYDSCKSFSIKLRLGNFRSNHTCL